MNTEEAREALHVSLPMQAFRASLPYLLVLGLIALAAYWLIDPAPPKKMVISISKEDGNYQAYASLSAALLQTEGITRETREGEGPLRTPRNREGSPPGGPSFLPNEPPFVGRRLLGGNAPQAGGENERASPDGRRAGWDAASASLPLERRDRGWGWCGDHRCNPILPLQWERRRLNPTGLTTPEPNVNQTLTVTGA